MDGTAVDTQLLGVFLAVAEESSFSRAAKRLRVGKASVSRALRRLESQVGVELIHRTTHQVALSTAGAALYERAAPHLRALEQAVCKLPELDEQPSGVLRLTAAVDLGVTLLPAVIGEFARRHPQVRFELRVTNARIDLVKEGIDLAIRASPGRLKDSTLTARRLGTGEARWYAAPSYLARRGEPREVGDPRHDWVVFPPIQAFIHAPRDFRPRVTADDFFCLRELLCEGVGVGPLPVFVAEPRVRAGTLQAVMAQAKFRGTAGYFLVYPSSGQVPRKVIAFRDFLVEWMKTRGF